MIKIVIGALFGHAPDKARGLMVECGDQSLSVKGADGRFPPFASIDLEVEEARQLALFLMEQLKNKSSKYSVGQEVWRLNDEYEPHSFVVKDVDYESDEKYLEDEEGEWWMEEQLYSSRKELIEAYLNYWLRMLEMPEQIRFFANQAKPMCDHDTGSIAPSMLAKDLICIKCGDRIYAGCIADCEHESDGMIYTSNPPQNKCKKCGEFYR